MHQALDIQPRPSTDNPYCIETLKDRLWRTESWFEDSEQDHLGHLEEELRNDFNEFLRQRLEASAQKKSDDTPSICPKCSIKLKKCEWHTKTIQTGAGPIKIRRLRGWCSKCKEWRFPADELLGINDGVSPYVEKMASLFASKMPFAEGTRTMKEATGIDLCESKMKRVVGGSSKKAQSKRADMDEKAPTQPPENSITDPTSVTMVIEIDAWNIRERNNWGETKAILKAGGDLKRWHWTWTGTVFTLDKRAKKGDRHVIIERGYVATRQGLDGFREQLHAEAMRRGLGQVGRTIIIGDGAAWIWNLCDDRFGGAIQRLDLYHLHQHLWAASKQMHERTEEALRWYNRMKKAIGKGKYLQVISKMEEALEHLSNERREALEKEIKYMDGHRERMDYDQAHERNEPLGSGAIESTCRQYQCRFKRPGQFWSTEGAEGILCLDTFWRNERWNELFPHSSRSNLSKN